MEYKPWGWSQITAVLLGLNPFPAQLSPVDHLLGNVHASLLGRARSAICVTSARSASPRLGAGKARTDQQTAVCSRGDSCSLTCSTAQTGSSAAARRLGAIFTDYRPITYGRMSQRHHEPNPRSENLVRNLVHFSASIPRTTVYS